MHSLKYNGKDNSNGRDYGRGGYREDSNAVPGIGMDDIVAEVEKQIKQGSEDHEKIGLFFVKTL